MYYIKITHVPLLRKEHPPNVPLARAICRLSEQETIEFRLQKLNNEICCFLGFETKNRAEQIAETVSIYGYITEMSPQPETIKTTTLLHRKTTEHAIINPGCTPELFTLPVDISDNQEENGVMASLIRMDNGSGISFFFHRADNLPLSTMSYLHRSKPAENTLPWEIINARCLYEGIGCVYGLTDTQKLTSDVLSTFYGLTYASVPSTSVSEDLIKTFHSLSRKTPAPVLPLQTLFLQRDLESIGNITISAENFGLPINKDTLFSIPTKYPLQEDSQNEKTLILGNSQFGTPVKIPLRNLKFHTMIAGAVGSGKGNEQFCIINQLHSEGVPLLLIESAKNEMHYLRKICPDLNVWRPKDGEFVLNPFGLQGDIALGEMRPSLIQVLRECFQLDGPLEELFNETMNNCYTNYGFTDNSTNSDINAQPFGMSEFMEEYNKLLNQSEYSGRTKSDIKTAGLVRLNSLFNNNRAVFDTVHSVPVKELLQGENLIQLNCLPTVEAKQMFASMLLIYINTYLRLRGHHLQGSGLKLCIIIDECHNLLSPVSDAQGNTYSFSRDFCNILLELRSQGIGVILTDQSANNLPEEVISTCNTKIFMGSSLSSGIEENRKCLNADDIAMENLYLLNAGEGCFTTIGMPYGVFFRAPNIIDKFGLDEPYPHQNTYLEKNSRLTIETFCECDFCPFKGNCTMQSKAISRQKASLISQRYSYKINSVLNQPNTDQQKIIKGYLSKMISDIFRESKDACEIYCTAIQLVREINRKTSRVISPKNFIETITLILKSRKDNKND